MPFTKTWDEASPTKTDPAEDLDIYITDDKIAVRERLESLLGIADFSTRFPMSADALKMNGGADTYILGGTATWKVKDPTGVTDLLIIDTVTGLITLSAITTGLINGQTISATANFTGTLNVVDDFSVNTNKFTVDSPTGNTLVAGTLGVTGDFAINTNKFTVIAASGNTLIAGTGDVTGDFKVNINKFTVIAASGNTLVAGTLDATGDFKVNTNKFSVVAASGNTTVAGTLTVDNTASNTPLIFTDASIAGARTVTLKNTNVGASGYAGIAIGNSAANVVLNMFGTGYTTSGTNVQAGAALISYGVGGLSVGTYLGDLRLYAGNTLAGTLSGSTYKLNLNYDLTVASYVTIGSSGSIRIIDEDGTARSGSVSIDPGNTGANSTFYIKIDGTTQVTAINGKFLWNTGDVILAGSGAALNTAAVTGFPYIPTCAGTPTGVPTNKDNSRSPIIHDTTNGRLYVYDNIAGAWKYATLT